MVWRALTSPLKASTDPKEAHKVMSPKVDLEAVPVPQQSKKPCANKKKQRPKSQKRTRRCFNKSQIQSKR